MTKKAGACLSLNSSLMGINSHQLKLLVRPRSPIFSIRFFLNRGPPVYVTKQPAYAGGGESKPEGFEKTNKKYISLKKESGNNSQRALI